MRNRSQRAAIGRACALAALTFAGCATSKSAQRPIDDLTPPDKGWREASDEASRTMRSIASMLQPAGVTPSRDGFDGFLSTGARTTHALHLAEKTCATLVAVASRAVHDMDATLYNAEGAVLASDTQPDAHPLIQVCSGAEPVTLYYALQVYDGAGTYLIVPFFGDDSTLEPVATVLGAKPGLARLDAPSAEGPGRIGTFREGLQRRGFEPSRDEVRFPLVRDQRLRVSLPVEPGQCYTAAGFALEGIDDIDLRVLDDEGAEVARDESGDPDASAQFCSERRAEYAAEIYGTKEPGTAVFLVLQVSEAAIGGVSGLWLGERPLTPPSKIPLSDAISEVTRKAARDGFKPVEGSVQGRLAQGEAVSHTLALRPRRCARIQAVGGPGLRRMSLTARDGTGATLALAEGGVDSTYVHLCGNVARELELQVRATEGAGPFALAVYDAARTELTPEGADDRISAVLQQALRSARDAGFTPHAEFRTGPRLLEVKSGGPASLPLRLAARCMRAYVISAEPSVASSIVSAGKVVAEPNQGEHRSRFCAPAGQGGMREVAVNVTTAAPSATAFVLVLER